MMHVVNGVVEKDEIGESPMREAKQLQFAQTISISFNSGAYLRNRSTVSQCARPDSAALLASLTWMGPLSSTRTTGLFGVPGSGPQRRSSNCKCAMKSELRLV